MDEEQIVARMVELGHDIEEAYAELDEIEIAREIEYRVEEGFWEVIEKDGEFYIFPVADEVEVDIPV